MAHAKMMKFILICLLGSGFFVQAQEVNKAFNRQVLNEQFDQIDKNWNSIFNADNLFIAQNGYYDLFRQNKQSGYYLFPNKSESYKGFLLETKVQFAAHDNKSESAGIVVMANEAGGGLLIEWSQKKAFRIVRIYKDKQIPINGQSGEGWIKSSAISKTDNTISLKTYDKIYDLYINQTFVKSFTDIELSRGKVGIYVGPDSKVRFDYLKIWEEDIKEPLQIDTAKSTLTDVQAYTKVIVKLKEQLQSRDRNIEILKNQLSQCETNTVDGTKTIEEHTDTSALRQQLTVLQIENDSMRKDLMLMEDEIESLQQFKHMVQQGNEGDIVIQLTQLLDQYKKHTDSLTQLNKRLEFDNKTMFVEVKELVKTMDRNQAEILQFKQDKIRLNQTIDSLQKVLQVLRPTETSTPVNTKPLSDEEKLQQMIEKEKEERRKRKEEEDKKPSEDHGQ